MLHRVAQDNSPFGNDIVERELEEDVEQRGAADARPDRHALGLARHHRDHEPGEQRIGEHEPATFMSAMQATNAAQQVKRAPQSPSGRSVAGAR
jgi:hypothetical protein